MTGLEFILPAIGAVGSAVGTVVSAGAAEEQGKAAQQAAEMQAMARERQAREREAAAGREAASQERKTNAVLSRQQAVAAASGGGATDPTVLDLMGDTAAQGAYNSASALYEGFAAGRSLDEQAAIDRFRGQQARRAGQISSMGTLLSGVSNFASAAKGLRMPSL